MSWILRHRNMRWKMRCIWIAEFLNGLSDTARAQVLVNLYAPIHGQEPVVMESDFLHRRQFCLTA